MGKIKMLLKRNKSEFSLQELEEQIQMASKIFGIALRGLLMAMLLVFIMTILELMKAENLINPFRVITIIIAVGIVVSLWISIGSYTRILQEITLREKK